MLCGIICGKQSEAQLEVLLRTSDFDINRAACTVFDGVNDGEPSSALREDAVQQQPATKRPRTGEARNSASGPTPWTRLAPPPAQHTPQDTPQDVSAAQQHAAELRSAELSSAELRLPSCARPSCAQPSRARRLHRAGSGVPSMQRGAPRRRRLSCARQAAAVRAGSSQHWPWR